MRKGRSGGENFFWGGDTNVVASRERRQTETPTARAKSSDNFQSILSLTIWIFLKKCKHSLTSSMTKWWRKKQDFPKILKFSSCSDINLVGYKLFISQNHNPIVGCNPTIGCTSNSCMQKHPILGCSYIPMPTLAIRGHLKVGPYCESIVHENTFQMTLWSNKSDKVKILAMWELILS